MNLIPMVVLWSLAGLVVWGYYTVPFVSGVLEPFARWQRESGWTASFASRFVFCGLLPGVFMLTFRTLHVSRPVLAVLVQTLWSGICGIVSGWMFSLHAVLLGEGADWATLGVKTAIQQFVWTPLFFAPVGAIVYLWIGSDFSWRSVRTGGSRSFFAERLLPNLFVNWIIWIPVGFAVHAFPTPLQVHIAGFANAFLCLVLLTLGKRT